MSNFPFPSLQDVLFLPSAKLRGFEGLSASVLALEPFRVCDAMSGRSPLMNPACRAKEAEVVLTMLSSCLLNYFFALTDSYLIKLRWKLSCLPVTHMRPFATGWLHICGYHSYWVSWGLRNAWVPSQTIGCRSVSQ